MNKVNKSLPCRTRLASALGAGLALAMLWGVHAGHAQALQNPAQLNIPYGKSYNDFNQPFDPRSRDANGNRTIINGLILNGDQSTLSRGIGGSFFSGGGSFGSVGGFGGGGAIGNQLNVITQGNWNTVIIDSTQINNGNQTVNMNGIINNNINNSGAGTSTTNDNASGHNNGASAGNTGTPAMTTLEADGPFRVAPKQNFNSGQSSGSAPRVEEELNGGIKLND